MPLYFACLDASLHGIGSFYPIWRKTRSNLEKGSRSLKISRERDRSEEISKFERREPEALGRFTIILLRNPKPYHHIWGILNLKSYKEFPIIWFDVYTVNRIERYEKRKKEERRFADEKSRRGEMKASHHFCIHNRFVSPLSNFSIFSYLMGLRGDMNLCSGSHGHVFKSEVVQK